MQISVALCTYNGASYLQAQLDSIAAQTRLPDELVVCDDVSTDKTMEILQRFATTAAFPVRIHRNDSNLGSTRNFDKAINLCNGDVIALADQDDVWLPHKLAQFEAAFVTDPDIGLVFSDSVIVDANLNDTGLRMSDTFGLGEEVFTRLGTPQALHYLARRNYITGATMAFKACFRPLISPISPHWVHDYWIAFLIATQAKIIPVSEPLILYRQHAKNQIGLKQRKPFYERATKATSIPPEAYQRTYERMRDMRQHLQEKRISLPSAEAHFLSEKMAHSYVRANLPKSVPARLRMIAAEVINGRYQRYAPNGMMSALRDVLA